MASRFSDVCTPKRVYGCGAKKSGLYHCVLSSGALNVRFCSPALRRRPELLRELTEGFLHTLNEIAAYTGFSGRMADAADTYSDDALTLGELSALNAIFNGVDEDEQN